MKKLIGLLLAVCMVCLSVTAVSADTPLILSPDFDIMPPLTIAEPPVTVGVTTVPVYLNIEAPDSLYLYANGEFAVDGSVSVADVILSLCAGNDITVEGLEYGYVSAIDGIEAGLFGGLDGWMYAVKYYATAEDGSTDMNIDVPTVSMTEYTVTQSCQIILYYGEFDTPFATSVVDDDGFIRLITLTPEYDDSYTLKGFTETPLAGGKFAFTKYTENEDGSVTLGSKRTFTADKDGRIKLSADLHQLRNGNYYGSIFMPSDKNADLNGKSVNLSSVVRASDSYTVNNKPSPDLVRMLIMILLSDN